MAETMAEKMAEKHGALGALSDLRRARRRHRLADIHWSDAIYRVYVFALCVGGFVWWVIATLGSRPVDATGLVGFVRWAPVASGGVLAAMLWGGLRSGLRGGPIALEHAELVHVLGSPLPRERILRYPALQQFRRGIFLGAGIGAVAGRFTSPFVPGGGARWTLVGSLFGIACGALWMASALVASGRRLPSLPTQSIPAVLSALTVANIWRTNFPAPLSVLGRGTLLGLPTKALRVSTQTSELTGARTLSPLVAMAITVILVTLVSALAFASCAGINIERAQQRAALVGQLRFAVTTQDLRAVVLVRRQLNSEVHLRKPWVRIPSGKGVERAVLARSARSLARWPARRFVRLLLIGLVAGVAAQAGWQGALPLFLIPGFAAFLAGLDVVEPLSQDADHLSLLASYPRHRGRLANRLIVVPAAVMVVIGLTGGLAGWLAAVMFGDALQVNELAPALAIGVVWALSGTLAAALSVALGPPPFMMMIQTPEMGFARMAAFPGLAVASVGVPMFLARRALQDGNPPGPMLLKSLFVALFMSYAVLNVLTSGGVREPK